MIKLLHFADAHIDIANYGRHDPISGLPLRSQDFLKSLDTIVQTALDEKVDLVLFAGDAYKDRSPAPTFQREFGRRIKRLSQAGIPTLLLVGNHDVSPALGRAHAIQEFDTLQVPHVHVVSKPALLGPGDLEDLPLQVMALPWVSRSTMMSMMDNSSGTGAVYEEIEKEIQKLVKLWLDKVDPSLPVILTAHASVQGAKYGGERSVMLGSDLVLSGSLVRDPRISYTALGHIHKAQDLNEGHQPPVVYPGSIERVDFGEVADDKYFVIAHVEQSNTKVEWHKLDGRRFIDRLVKIASDKDIYSTMVAALPSRETMQNAIVRLTVEYRREWEPLLDEPAMRHHAEGAFEFHLVRKPQIETRLRIPHDQAISSLDPPDLLEFYWNYSKTSAEDKQELNKLAKNIFSDEAFDI